MIPSGPSKGYNAAVHLEPTMRELADAWMPPGPVACEANDRLLANFQVAAVTADVTSVDIGAQPASLPRTQDRPGGRTSGTVYMLEKS